MKYILLFSLLFFFQSPKVWKVTATYPHSLAQYNSIAASTKDSTYLFQFNYKGGSFPQIGDTVTFSGNQGRIAWFADKGVYFEVINVRRAKR